MCGAGDSSMNHKDYCDWVCFVKYILFAQLLYIYIYISDKL